MALYLHQKMVSAEYQENQLVEFHQILYEPVRDKTNKMDQNMDFRVLVFFDRMDNAL